MKIFLSTPSARRATARFYRRLLFHEPFLSTPSARRATKNKDSFISVKPISIHALREEGDSAGPRIRPDLQHFYPRPPRGGRHRYKPSKVTELFHFYPRPPRGGRPAASAKTATGAKISIHALREEGDLLQQRQRPEHHPISIHALREEGDVFFCSRVSCDY